MLYEVMKYLRNFFPSGIYKTGKFEIIDGTITLPLKAGQYILIEGSALNDGVYRYPVSGLTDEDFEGTISVLVPPVALLNIVHEMEEYTAKNDLNIAYTSETFGGYSYTKATDKNGNLYGIFDVYKKRLALWKKV